MFFEETINHASSLSGLPQDQLRFVFAAVAVVFFSPLVKKIPTDTGKHLVSIVVTCFLITFCDSYRAIFHPAFTSLVVYFICRFGPKSKAHILVFVFSMTYMSLSHIYRMWNSYNSWDLDFTTAQMLITVKFTIFGWNVYDGSRDEKTLSPYQKSVCLKTLPSLLEFLGYICFYPGWVAGPPFEYTVYNSFITGKMFDDKYCKGKAPSSFLQAMKTVASAFVVVPFVLLAAYYPVSYTITDAFAVLPAWKKLLYVYSLTLYRFKFYFAWGLADAACVAAGIAYNGYEEIDGKMYPKWNRVTPAYPMRVELSTNTRDCTMYWNMVVANWLRRYVYERVATNAKDTTKATMATYAVSAFWHGFYPGYYLFFFYFGFMTELAKDARRIFRPLIVPEDPRDEVPKLHSPQPLKAIYDVVTFLTTQLIGTYAGVGFMLLSWGNMMAFYHNTNYVGIIILLVAFFSFRFVLLPMTKRRARLATRPPTMKKE